MRQGFGVSAGRFGLIGSVVVGILAAALFAAGAAAAEVGAIEHFSAKCGVEELVSGPDGNVWFTCNREEHNGLKTTYQSVIGRITPLGEITEFVAGIPSTAYVGHLAAGSEGNLWFTLAAGGKGKGGIGRITPSGQVTVFSAGLREPGNPDEIVAGTEGNIWFSDSRRPPEIGRITPAGAISEWPSGLSGSLGIGGLVGGPGGNLWFTQSYDLPPRQGEPGGTIARVDPSGTVTSFGGEPDAGGAPVLGADGNVWFANATHPALDRITSAGEISAFAPKLVGLGSHLALGPDGNVWFTQGQKIGKVTPSGETTTYTKCLAYRQGFSEATTIVPGPEGNLWFTSVTSRMLPSISEPSTVGRITPNGEITQFKGGIYGEPRTIVGGADGRVYFAGGGDQIQRITPPSEPVNTFVFAGGKSTRRGVAEIGVEVPGPGKLELKPLSFWRYGKPERKLNGTATVRAVAPGCGATQMRVRLPAPALSQLKREHEVRVNVRATFTPTGGGPNTELRQTTVRFK